jgi:hypothetical protein
MQEPLPPSDFADPVMTPAAVPRALTPRIARRAWTEPSVRVWWLLALAVLLVFAFYVADRLWDREIERRLIRDGAVVHAKLMGNSAKAIHGQTFSPGDIIQVRFDWNGQEVQPSGPIHSTAAVDEMVTIHVDRDDPQVWTDLTQIEPMLTSLFVGLLFLPVAPIVFAVAWTKQRAIQKQWQNGQAVEAIVHDRKQTPVAPMSYAVRCSLHNQRDKRLFTVYVPQGIANLEDGSTIWVITDSKQTRPVAALWFM